MDTAACVACCVKFSVAKHGLTCPVCEEKVVGSEQIIMDRFCDYDGVVPKILLECSAVGGIFHLAEVNVTEFVEELGKVFKIKQKNMLCIKCDHPVVFKPGSVGVCGTYQCSHAPCDQTIIAAPSLVNKFTHGSTTVIVDVQAYPGVQFHRKPTEQDVASWLTQRQYLAWEYKAPPGARCPLPVRRGLLASSDEKPHVTFLARLATFADRSKLALALADKPAAPTTPSLCDSALMTLMPLDEVEPMFFAAIMPWLQGKVAWSIHDLVRFSHGSPLWIVLRILPDTVPIVGLKCPQDLCPDDFDICRVPGLEFLRIYFGRDEAQHWCTAGAIAQRCYE